MSKRVTRKNEPPPRVIAQPPSPQSLGLDDFGDGDEGGLSLEELGKTYAALLNRGADPYPAAGVESAALPPEAQVAALLSGGSSREESPQAEDEPVRVLSGNDDEACEITPRTILEAILFVGHSQGEPLHCERIASLMRGVRASEIDDLAAELNESYDQDGCPYRVLSEGAGYRLALRPEFSPIREKFYGRVKEAKLNQAAIDLLAIIAYNQPISLAEIDRIRGRSSTALLTQLVRRELLQWDRDPTTSHPSYRTTTRFLDLYGLESLDDLPQVDSNL